MDEIGSSTSPAISASEMFLAAEEKLEQTSQATATHAFNLAISFGLLPLIILMLLVFILVRGSLPVLLISGILSALVLIIFASLVVNTSRERALQRVYREQIQPELLASGEQLGIASSELSTLAQQTLPEGALLLKLLHSSGGGLTPAVEETHIQSLPGAQPISSSSADLPDEQQG